MSRRVLIVDDEEPGRINLRYALARHADWRVVGECAGVAQARALLARDEVDLVFVDVRMPFESGIDLARGLSALAEPPLIVFVTAFDVHAVEAFEAEHGVATTPQIWIDGARIGGSDDLEAYLAR